MILKYSAPKKIPYIEFDDGNKLIFATLVENEKGFNSFVFSGKTIMEYKIGTKKKTKTGKTKKPNLFQISDNINFITDIKLSSIPKEVKGSNKTFSPVVLKFLKKTIKDLTVDEHFPRKNLDVLARRIDDFFKEEDDINDTVDNDPDLMEDIAE